MVTQYATLRKGRYCKSYNCYMSLFYDLTPSFYYLRFRHERGNLHLARGLFAEISSKPPFLSSKGSPNCRVFMNFSLARTRGCRSWLRGATLVSICFDTFFFFFPSDPPYFRVTFFHEKSIHSFCTLAQKLLFLRVIRNSTHSLRTF